MKRKILIMIITILVFFPFEAKANIVNKLNVNITEEDYKMLLNDGYIKEDIDWMSNKELNKIIDCIKHNVKIEKESYYIKQIYHYNLLGQVTDIKESIVNKDEYYGYIESPSIASSAKNNIWTTTYKKLSVNMWPGTSNKYYGLIQLQWLKMPKVRSNDFIAGRFVNMSTELSKDIAIEFIQEFSTSSHAAEIVNITSSENSHLLKQFSNGFIAVLPLSSRTDLNAIVVNAEITLKKESGKVGELYGTYQHATDPTTYQNIINTAKIDANGFGKVISVGNAISSYFDNMQGVNIKTNEI